ncbi:hypothetical protein DES53_101714 [Roseimicrobium gellanilyticum]|uniref:Caspase domain-containing protein n=1 Tax=Roseimicrobium gellanilyticum TaxID=748857 RepID=A0A366HWG1_9BACT|nr:hypothetical protein [Roseimicrobium gellanilyticum]RBP47914.1 hypothetical protein DES53_101714 [Roseimicrobium gellanilyticum]
MRKNRDKGKGTRDRMGTIGACLVTVCALLGVVSPLIAQTKQEPEARELRVLIVMGAQGTEEYGKRYREEVQLWEDACKKAGVEAQTIGVAAEQKEKPDAMLLQETLKALSAKPTQPLWLVLIGHGTFDGRDARFNLRGPDIMAPELAGWLKPFSGQVACIQTASASAPFLKALAGPNRVLISATKSADEVFYTRFGQFFVKAIGGSEEADLDRDHQVSLLEAFLWSSKQVDRFFETEQRLATEHALIEDNGDGIGTRAQAFLGVRLAEAPPEGKTAEGLVARQWALLLSDADAQLTDTQRTKRDALEREVEALKGKRKELGDEAYYTKLEALMLEISRIYESPDKDT